MGVGVEVGPEVDDLAGVFVAVAAGGVFVAVAAGGVFVAVAAGGIGVEVGGGVLTLTLPLAFTEDGEPGQ